MGAAEEEPRLADGTEVIFRVPGIAAVLAVSIWAQRPDGLYAEIRTTKGLVVARLEADLTPMTVANFVGLAEGTIANTAFDPGRPFYDGVVYHRVVPGHVAQAGVPQSDRARGPGYTFPNEIHAKLSHNHAGALNMANAGPHTNGSQFCIMLGDRSYLDGDYTVFGDVVEGLDIALKIQQGDTIESIRIARIGAKAQSFRPTTESFQAQVKAAQQRVAGEAEKKRAAGQEWLAKNYPADDTPQAAAEGRAIRLRYRGFALRFLGHVIGREGPPVETISFASGHTGAPVFLEAPAVFQWEPGKTKINAGFDATISTMKPGERRTVIVPAESAYARAGFYPPEVPGQRRLVIWPNTTLVYEIEAIAEE